MLRGNYRGQAVGSGTDMWKFWDDARAGQVGECELADLECGIARSPGHCMTMGTASTMTSAAEALGMTLPGMASIPAVDSAHYRMAAATGRRIVDMVWEDLTPDKILTREAFEDAAATVLALGGSTNALIHLIAMAGRAGVRADPGRLRRDLPPGAVAGQHPAQRDVPDGGLLLRRRPAAPCSASWPRSPGRCTWTGSR